MDKKSIYALIIIVLILGAVFLFYKFYRIKTPIVGVIKIEGYMLDNYHRDLWIKAAQYALENDTIKAVVLRIDSGGGSASICEDLYGVFKKLAQRKPLVVVVEGIAASGGYYVSLAGREIYATPSSLIGNIGVISVVPPIVLPGESIIETGVYKYTGFLIDEYPLKVNEIYESFVNAVNESRGTRLKVPLSTLIDGRLLIGSEAVKTGLVDRIGSYFDAIESVSKLAGLTNFEIVDLNKIVISKDTKKMEKTEIKDRISLRYLVNISRKGMNFYYIPPQLIDYDYNSSYAYSILKQRFTYRISNATGKIVIDLSHKNLFPYLLMSRFLGKLVEEGEKIVYLSEGNLAKILDDKPKALLIFMPLYEYSFEDLNAIEKFVKGGGKLVLFYDPGFGPYTMINSIAQDYGFIFSVGYLYNSYKKYGIYRNIILTNFSKNSLTENISAITLFTASAIFTKNDKLAWTTNDTALSILYKNGTYTVIAKKGSVLALSDISFIMDPFLKLTDNEKFLDNLVNWIVREKS